MRVVCNMCRLCPQGAWQRLAAASQTAHIRSQRHARWPCAESRGYVVTVAATGTAPSSSVDTVGHSSASTDTDVSSGPSEEQQPEQQQQTKHMHMSEPLYAYLLQHTREPAVLAALRADTAAQFPAAARMAISPEQGAFLAWLLRTLQARRVIEVGVFTGYSSIALALALPPTGTLLACDRDPRSMTLAREYWAKAGVADKVHERLGPAAATLDELLADPTQHGSYDFAFIDADKKGYRAYYEQLLQLVRPGGVIAIDNTLWYGRVADAENTDGATLALRELNAFLVADKRIMFSLVPVGDGIEPLESVYQASSFGDNAVVLDRIVAAPWTALWLAILWRHWHALTAVAVFRSFLHYLAIISPVFLTRVLAKQTYLRYRVAIIALALLSYTLHPGGGLYRDAVMARDEQWGGNLAALTLFMRLLVGSRTLFWLVLRYFMKLFGYRLPPQVMIPLHGALLAIKLIAKPSQPFCAVLQTPATQPLFEAIAANLPLFSLIPLDRPAIRAGADICNPLHTWVVVVLAWALPAAASLVSDFEARQRFVARCQSQVVGVDRERWLGKARGSCAPGAVAVLLWVHLATALWFLLMYRQMLPPYPVVPKVTIDPHALKQGIWGNTWKEWGRIMLAFGVLYAILAGYFTGLLFAAKGIRRDEFRTMSGKYFGKFDRQLFNASIDILPNTESGGSKNPFYFNRPEGCTEVQTTESLPGFPDISINQSIGILACSTSDKQWRWTVYPWVVDTNGLGSYPGCATANAEGVTPSTGSFISDDSPAGEDAGNSTQATRNEYVCQNGLPNQGFAPAPAP
ncbi:O-methyltransferase MdmC [Chlorella vulgaris]